MVPFAFGSDPFSSRFPVQVTLEQPHTVVSKFEEGGDKNGEQIQEVFESEAGQRSLSPSEWINPASVPMTSIEKLCRVRFLGE